MIARRDESLGILPRSRWCSRMAASESSPWPVSAIKHVRMTRILVRWIRHAGQLVSEAVTGRRLSFVLLLATLAAHLVCVSWVAAGERGLPAAGGVGGAGGGDVRDAPRRAGAGRVHCPRRRRPDRHRAAGRPAGVRPGAAGGTTADRAGAVRRRSRRHGSGRRVLRRGPGRSGHAGSAGAPATAHYLRRSRWSPACPPGWAAGVPSRAGGRARACSTWSTPGPSSRRAPPRSAAGSPVSSTTPSATR